MPDQLFPQKDSPLFPTPQQVPPIPQAPKKSGKKILKIVGILVILVIAIFGGYWALANYFPQYAKYVQPYLGPVFDPIMEQIGLSEPTASPTPQPLTSPTGQPSLAGWKTYQNFEYGFEFKYPNNFSSHTYVGSVPLDSSLGSQLKSAKIPCETVGSFNGELRSPCFYYTGLQIGTIPFEGASFEVSSSDKVSTSQCGREADVHGTVTKEITISGIAFHWYESGDSPRNFLAVTKDYGAYRNGRCYHVILRVTPVEGYDFAKTHDTKVFEILDQTLSTFKFLPDADGDGLPDSEEAKYGANPNNPDTDGDTWPDGEEVQNGYNPLGPGRAN